MSTEKVHHRIFRFHQQHKTCESTVILFIWSIVLTVMHIYQHMHILKLQVIHEHNPPACFREIAILKISVQRNTQHKYMNFTCTMLSHF
jgi:hypothetical protein